MFESENGAIEIRYRGRLMRWTEIAHQSRARPTPMVPPAPVTVLPDALRLRPNVSADHPWHHGAQDYAQAQQLAKDRRAWARVQP